MTTHAPTSQRESIVAPRPSRYRWLALGGGIVALSTASILIRLAGDGVASPLAVGAWRMLLATALLTPLALPRWRRERARLTRREMRLLLLSSVVLALHFATWITSLEYTTVASSVILVTTNPIYVGLASHFLLKQRLGRVKVAAIVVALAGSVLISYGDLGISGKALLGDALALLGALAASAYILLGYAVRRKLSTLAYVWPCYGLAGGWLLLFCLLTGQPLWGYAPQTYVYLFLLAVVPQILGHSTFNWALAHVSPLVVTLAILGEPVGATLLAALILHEVPSIAALAGGVLILAGIALASREEASEKS
ncbi:MAG: DMT family transporter [Chloroflexi bacterium]|jgi:drug/metabolite transporter (DMT)-like permease|nr:DMT family transporter [Chloroflexota bacterium]